MYKNAKQKALLMRKGGASLNEIARKLLISKSTASVWCRNVSLSAHAVARLASRSNTASVAGLQRYSQRVAERRTQQEKEDGALGADTLGCLTPRDIYCIGLGLYWGEGYKRGSQEFGFTNSDPEMIRFYITWLREVFGVTEDNLILRLSLNETYRSRTNDLLKYWANICGVKTSQFSKTSYLKTAHKRSYTPERVYRGTVRIKVKNGTRLRRQVLGAISACGSSYRT